MSGTFLINKKIFDPDVTLDSKEELLICHLIQQLMHCIVPTWILKTW